MTTNRKITRVMIAGARNVAPGLYFISASDFRF
jgi:hypothetical protein